MDEEYLFFMAACGHEGWTSLPKQVDALKAQLCPTCFRQALADQGDTIISHLPELWLGLVNDSDQKDAEFRRKTTILQVNRWIGLHERVGFDAESWRVALGEMVSNKKHPYFWLHFRGLDALSQMMKELSHCA